MKKLFMLFIGVFLLISASIGQTKAVVRPQGVGISFFLTDFLTPDRIRKTSLGSVISDDRFASLSDMTPGIAVTYFKGLTNRIDFAGSLGGSFIKYPFPKRTFATDRF